MSELPDRRGTSGPWRDLVFFVVLLVTLWFVGIVAFGVALAIGLTADYPTGLMVLVDWISRGLTYVLGFPFLYVLQVPGAYKFVQPFFGNPPEFSAFGLSAFTWASFGLGVRRYLGRRRTRSNITSVVSGE